MWFYHSHFTSLLEFTPRMKNRAVSHQWAEGSPEDWQPVKIEWSQSFAIHNLVHVISFDPQTRSERSGCSQAIRQYPRLQLAFDDLFVLKYFHFSTGANPVSNLEENYKSGWKMIILSLTVARPWSWGCIYFDKTIFVSSINLHTQHHKLHTSRSGINFLLLWKIRL